MYIFKFLIYTGTALIITGLIALGLVKMGLILDKLPGDIYIRKEKYGVCFPIVTSLILSVFLTVILNVVFWILKK